MKKVFQWGILIAFMVVVGLVIHKTKREKCEQILKMGAGLVTAVGTALVDCLVDMDIESETCEQALRVGRARAGCRMCRSEKRPGCLAGGH